MTTPGELRSNARSARLRNMIRRVRRGFPPAAATEVSERQVLVEELRATQEDLALAHLEAGARAERERLTREIHDTLAQDFTSVVLAARRLRSAAESGDEETARRELDHIEDLGRTGVDRARRLVRDLAPAELDDRPLPAALALLARPTAVGGDPVVEVRVDGEPRPLDAEAEVAVLRVAQESVTNARRHSGADRVVVTITYLPDAVSIDVVDDGEGFDPRETDPRRFGIAGMRRRIEQLGGRFTVETAPGEGTTVNASIPTAGVHPADACLGSEP